MNKILHNESLVRFFDTVKKRMTTAEITNSAVVISYYLLLSLFPLVIAMGNILPYLKIEPSSALVYIEQVVPERVFSILEPTIHGLLTQRSGGLLSVSALGTLWAASQSINAIQTTMNKTYGVQKRSNALLVRLLSVGFVLLLLVAVLVVIGIFGLGQIVLDYIVQTLNMPDDFITMFKTLKWPTTILVLLVVMSIIYYLVPNAKIRFRSVIPGALFTTFSWMLLSQGFGIYARIISNQLSSYEIFGSIIILMLWLNIASTCIILGGIINAVLEEMTVGPIQERNTKMRHFVWKK